MNVEKTNKPTFSSGTSGKFLFMRHGQTWYNRSTDLTRRYNPDLCDAHLSDEGINQIKSIQEIINKLNLEKIYVSPYYRALQTVTIALENYPRLKDIIIIVHPKISEVVCGAHDIIFDIKKTKKDFNMDSKVKIDWSYFDKYVKGSNYEENFFYFENIDLLDEKEKNEEYCKLKKLYDENDAKESYKKELKRFLKEKSKINFKYESLRHPYKRFEEFKEYLINEYKDTLNDNNKKILCVSHNIFISTAIIPKEELYNENSKLNLHRLKNGEIITFFI